MGFQIFEQNAIGNDELATEQVFKTAELAAEEAKSLAVSADGAMFRVFAVGGDRAKFEALKDTWHWV